jgi:glutamyl-tRNA synthetase
LADLHTLGIIPDKVSFTSDYFDKIEELGVKILELGKAYCDDTPVEEVYPSNKFF